MVQAISDDKGRHTSRTGIAQAFADFYSQLYLASDELRESHVDPLQVERGQSNNISPEEASEALTKMKRGKTCAEDGLVAEMLQHA